MYCKKCGKETENKNNICNSCQIENQNKKSNKVISIVGIITSIIVPPIGFVISLIGLLTGKKYKENYKKLNILGIVLSIILTIVQILLIVFFVLFVINKLNEPLVGEWKCTDNSFSSLTNGYIEFNLKDNKTFIWSPYNSSQNNYVMGNYKINRFETTNGRRRYEVTLDVKNTIVNGRKTSLNSDNVNLKIYQNSSNKDSITVYFDSTYKTYYCSKVK